VVKFFDHHVQPIPLELFIEAMAASHTHIVEADAEELEAMPVGQPVSDPDRFRSARWGDRMASGMGGVMSVFQDDKKLGTDRFLRLYTLMKLISKRSFKRFRHGSIPGDDIRVSEAFIRAAASMPLTHHQATAWKPCRRRRLKHALVREARRQELLEEQSGA
jgi:hypothetical protein